MTAQEWVGKLCRRWYVLAAVLLCTMGGLWAVHGRSITYRGCDELFLGCTATAVEPQRNHWAKCVGTHGRGHGLGAAELRTDT